jgi:hypothetical protein
VAAHNPSEYCPCVNGRLLIDVCLLNNYNYTTIFLWNRKTGLKRRWDPVSIADHLSLFGHCNMNLVGLEFQSKGYAYQHCNDFVRYRLGYWLQRCGNAEHPASYVYGIRGLNVPSMYPVFLSPFFARGLIDLLVTGRNVPLASGALNDSNIVTENNCVSPVTSHGSAISHPPLSHRLASEEGIFASGHNPNRSTASLTRADQLTGNQDQFKSSSMQEDSEFEMERLNSVPNERADGSDRIESKSTHQLGAHLFGRRNNTQWRISATGILE